MGKILYNQKCMFGSTPMATPMVGSQQCAPRPRPMPTLLHMPKSGPHDKPCHAAHDTSQPVSLAPMPSCMDVRLDLPPIDPILGGSPSSPYLSPRPRLPLNLVSWEKANQLHT